MSGLRRHTRLERRTPLDRGSTGLSRGEGLSRTGRLRSKSRTNSGKAIARTTEPMPPRTRAAVIARAGGRCELDVLGHERCGGRADDVHHRYPKEYGGSHAEANLMALCEWHNRHWAETYRDEAERLGVRFRRWQAEPTVPWSLTFIP